MSSEYYLTPFVLCILFMSSTWHPAGVSKVLLRKKKNLKQEGLLLSKTQSKHIKVKKNTVITKQNVQIFVVIPFFKLRNNS